MLTILYVLFHDKVHEHFKEEDLEYLGTTKETVHEALVTCCALIDSLCLVVTSKLLGTGWT